MANSWKKAGSVVLTALPLGDGKVSTTASSVGSVYSCSAGNASLGGSNLDGPWIHGTTWDFTAKVQVAGANSWPTAKFSIQTQGANRVIATNDLPTGQQTGSFPISSSDPAHTYDGNPNTISTSANLTLTLPVSPTPSSAPSCLGGGAVGVLLNGVLLYDALDGPGRDAVAHEEQDLCQGHPQNDGEYHYHEIPTCLRDQALTTSTIVGWANDGYPIVVERDAGGKLPNNDDLDACHGRTSPITLDGAVNTSYHYSATLEFPYTIGCFHGTVTKSAK